MTNIKNPELGDFQTPLEFSKEVCNLLTKEGCNPKIVIEPTFGEGNFIMSSLESFNNIEQIYGVEIQSEYFHPLTEKLDNLKTDKNIILSLYRDNIFNHMFNVINQGEEILIIGNPPWVTNSKLGSIDSNNLPEKSNFKNLKGLDSITGKGNFDIAESIILKLLHTFKDFKGTLALLCKDTVCRNVLNYIPKGVNINEIKNFRIDAGKVFGTYCDASLLFIRFGYKEDIMKVCKVYNFDKPDYMIKQYGWQNDVFVSDITTYRNELEGKFPFEWRQGVKHDCATIMELKKGTENKLFNGLNEEIDIEMDLVFDLLKSSELRKPIIKETRKKVILTQFKAGEETEHLETKYPRLWNYLSNNIQYFNKRKSVIYTNKPKFSMFGIGSYSFKPYKVAISGLYKTPQFSLVLPIENKPVMFDDTCYFIGFDNYKDALLTYVLLSNKKVPLFLESISFLNSKRPYTKDILKRINLLKLTELMSFKDIQKVIEGNQIELIEDITSKDYTRYKREIKKIFK